MAEPFDVSQHHVGHEAVFVGTLARYNVRKEDLELQASDCQTFDNLPLGPCFLNGFVRELELGPELDACFRQEEVVDGHNGDCGCWTLLVRLAASSAEIAPWTPGSEGDVPTCPVLLDLFVAWLPRVGGNPNDLFFRCKVFSDFSGLIVIDLHLIFLFFSHIVVVARISMDIDTAHPVTVCDAGGFTCAMIGSYGSRAVGRAQLRYAP